MSEPMTRERLEGICKEIAFVESHYCRDDFSDGLQQRQHEDIRDLAHALKIALDALEDHWHDYRSSWSGPDESFCRYCNAQQDELNNKGWEKGQHEPDCILNRIQKGEG